MEKDNQAKRKGFKNTETKKDKDKFLFDSNNNRNPNIVVCILYDDHQKALSLVNAKRDEKIETPVLLGVNEESFAKAKDVINIQ